MPPIRSEIIINAPADKVWGLIMDVEKYHEWNPFTPRVSLTNKDITVGMEFDLDCQMTDTQLLKNEHEVILAHEPDNYKFCFGSSRTKGRPGIRSFRWQICEPIDDTRTHFINYEEFHGLLAPLVWLLYEKKMKTAFEKYCRALKERAEL